MKEKTGKTVRAVYGAALGAMTAIVGALFIWQTLSVYATGAFSRELVAERLALLAPAFWLWIALIFGGFVLWEVFPVGKKRVGFKDDVYALRKLKKKMPSSVGEEAASALASLRRQQRISGVLRLCCAAFCLAGAIYAVVYLAVPSHFPKSDVTAEMLAMAKHILPWTLAAFALFCAFAAFEAVSAKKQLAYLKKLTAGVSAPPKKQGKLAFVLHHKYFKTGVRIALACFGVTFVLLGIFNESMHGVLVKAINICTECIGLG